jgi:PadR family transcriptional regulator, regulatory protein PadR
LPRHCIDASHVSIKVIAVRYHDAKRSSARPARVNTPHRADFVQRVENSANTYFQNRYFAIVACMAKNPEHRDLFPGALEIMILHSLRLKPMHGYALVKHIKQVSGDLLQVEEGSLYPALQRMLKEGWLEAETGTSAKGRPTRIYQLTGSGLRRLEGEVVSFEKMFAGITRVLAAAKA